MIYVISENILEEKGVKACLFPYFLLLLLLLAVNVMLRAVNLDYDLGSKGHKYHTQKRDRIPDTVVYHTSSECLHWALLMTHKTSFSLCKELLFFLSLVTPKCNCN